MILFISRLFCTDKNDMHIYCLTQKKMYISYSTIMAEHMFRHYSWGIINRLIIKSVFKKIFKVRIFKY